MRLQKQPSPESIQSKTAHTPILNSADYLMLNLLLKGQKPSTQNGYPNPKYNTYCT